MPSGHAGIDVNLDGRADKQGIFRRASLEPGLHTSCVRPTFEESDAHDHVRRGCSSGYFSMAGFQGYMVDMKHFHQVKTPKLRFYPDPIAG
jgi:hypothetical protein